MTDMTQLLHSMESTMKLQTRARAERRAAKAEQEKKEFLQKLMQAEATKIELDGLASKAKGSDDAVQRDQLIGMMTAALVTLFYPLYPHIQFCLSVSFPLS